MLVVPSRFGFISGLPGSIRLTPSTTNEYPYRSGSSASVVTDQTPCSSFCIGTRWVPSRESNTSFALGARKRNVIRLSEETSGELTGGTEVWAQANAAPNSKQSVNRVISV